MRKLHFQRHLSHELSLVVSLLTAVFALPSIPLAAAQELVRPNPVYEAQRFLQTFYPETKGKGYTVFFSVGGAYDVEWKTLPRLEVAVLQTSSTPSLELLVEKGKPLDRKLAASFDYDKQGLIEGVTIAGPLVNDEKCMRVSQLVNAHKNWSDDHVVRALKEAGAKFGPEDKENFLASLPEKDLESLLGKLTIRSVEFYLRHDQVGGPIPELWWIVRADAKSADGNTRSFTLGFEPFAGKLTTVRKVP